MTRALAFTQASITRRISAARKAGLRVTGISASGTVLVQEAGDPMAIQPETDQDVPPSKWGDVKA